MEANDERATVLIVDDVRENLDVLDGLLKRDYNIKFATNGIMAVNVAKRFLPDIILMDIMMPEMDGFEATEILKNDPLTKDIPIIIVTTKNEDYDEVRGFALGASDYISKPISPTTMKGRVKTQLALYNQKRQLSQLVNEKTKELIEARAEIIRMLCITAEYKDKETGDHITRMSKFCYYIAQEYGFDQQKMDLILSASPLHDIGKIGIPDKIILKPGKLDPDEWEIMKTHCKIGIDILGDSKMELIEASRIIAYQHHEKWNGKGYPQGLKGPEIHIYARITAIADVFDALISKRPYKEPMKVNDAINIIKKESGEHFDPDVVEAFMKAMPNIKKIIKEYRKV